MSQTDNTTAQVAAPIAEPASETKEVADRNPEALSQDPAVHESKVKGDSEINPAEESEPARAPENGPAEPAAAEDAAPTPAPVEPAASVQGASSFLIIL